MLPLEHSAIFMTCIKRKLVLKTNFWPFFEWLLKTGFTVCDFLIPNLGHLNTNIFLKKSHERIWKQIQTIFIQNFILNK